MQLGVQSRVWPAGAAAMSLTGQPPEGPAGKPVRAKLSCPMPECRRPLESAFFSTTAMRTSEPCIHFVAYWRSPEAMVEAVVASLDGERELVIRNVRVHDPEVQRRIREADPEALAAAVRANLRVEEDATGGAAFGDRHQRAAASRDLAQIIAGPDPMLGGGSLR